MMRLASYMEHCRPRGTLAAARRPIVRSFHSLCSLALRSSFASVPSAPSRHSWLMSLGSMHSYVATSKPSSNIPKCPEILPSIPILKRPLIPGFYKTISIQDPKLADAVKKTVLDRTPSLIGTFLQRTSSEEDIELHPLATPESVYGTGTLCSVINDIPGPNGSLTLVVYPHYRIQIATTAPQPPDFSLRNLSIKANDASLQNEQTNTPEQEHAESNAGNWPASDPKTISLLRVAPLSTAEEQENQEVISALTQECLETLASVAKQNAFIREHLSSFPTLPGLDEPMALADLIAVLCSGPPELLQQLLEAQTAERRLRIALELLLREQEATQLQATLRKSVEERLTMRHREALLMEQMKAIQKELGSSASLSTAESLREKVLAQFQTRIAQLRAYISKTDDLRIKNLIALIDEEINRMSSIEPSSGEFGIIRTYLDWLTSLPWISSEKNVSYPSLQEARKILDADHWGLSEVKQRIIEVLASIHLSAGQPKDENLKENAGESTQIIENDADTANLNCTAKKTSDQTAETKKTAGVLLLVGPPGIGKTSIGTSIARALGKAFFKISLGGLNDVAELKGHRRTYLGAMPGKFVQALKQTQSLCPVILLDEIDKISSISALRSGGDPSAALLEALDGGYFMDHFLDYPVDLSGVTFVATANTIEGIPAPLLDRMSVVNLSSYTTSEKLAIGERHLLPKALLASGLSTKKHEWGELLLPSETTRCIIENWCRESGVRQLRQAIERICRRIAAEALEKGLPIAMEGIETCNKGIVVKERALPTLLGLPHFPREENMLSLPPGVVAGLAWTPYGGSILHIEVVAIGRERAGSHLPLSLPLRTTGHLGKVMEESASIAHTVARIYASASPRISPEIDTKSKSIDSGSQTMTQEEITAMSSGREESKQGALHMHVPEGATPKDGPSAGVAMAIALLSLARGESVRSGLGFTGELTLSGRVLRIGGLKEKVLAARREGLREVVFPAANVMEWTELEQAKPEPLVGPTVGLIGHPVSSFAEVIPMCFASAR